MSAVYGAMIMIPAFLLVRELSNKYGGILAAILVGTAPQILIRTFGSSYDSDQLVLFFILLTLYAGFYMFKKRSIPSCCLAIICFTAFLLTWNMFWYTFFILLIFIIVNMLVEVLKTENNKINLKINSSRIKNSMKKTKNLLMFFIILTIGIFVTGWITQMYLLSSLSYFLGFAQRAEAWIVNISIAELQPVDLADIGTWILAMGRFLIGIDIVDISVFIIFLIFIVSSLFFSLKKDSIYISFILTLLAVSFFTLAKGVRFSEFTSAIFLIIISAGFGYLIEFGFSKKEQIIKSIPIGTGILIILIALSVGLQFGQSLGPDQNSNWDSAWDFLKTKTPEFSVVGTWWDPGHMITGLAERRVYADGAHCDSSCMYTINDRITDLGKIMVTTDENVSLELIRKYQGDSPKVYWIASDDLIGKFQWLQYFGTGCDARSDSSCPLYMQIGESSRSFDEAGNIIIRNYGMDNQTYIMIYNAQIPIPIFVQGINAALFDEFIVYNDTEPVSIKFTEDERNSVLTALQPLERQLNIRFTNQTMSMTVWMPSHFSYIVIIPPHLRDSVFTKMFMLEGQGLEHFKQVFRNEQVKIYEVI
jgi:asparagine N-glycosylation enzyme membrane subunit Stt3